MALPRRAQPFVTQLLTSERFETLQRQTVSAVQKLGGQDTVLRFFHDPGCAKSWLMAQALCRFQSKYAVTVIPHTMPAPLSEYVRDVRAYRRFSFEDAKHQARYYGLDAPERLPEEGEIRTVAAELASIEGKANWLPFAVHLGDALFGGTSIPEAMLDLPELERNMQLAHQLGNYRGGAVFAHGAWYFGVDRFHLMEDAFRRLGSGEGDTLTRHPELLPKLKGDTLRFFFSFRSPFSYLALPRVLALVEAHGLKLELLPVLAPSEERRPAPVRKQLELLMDAGREARHHNQSFGRVSPLSQPAHKTLASIFYGLADDPDRQRQFLHSALHGIWSRGFDFNNERSLRKVQQEANISAEEVRAFDADRSWLACAHENGEYLEERGYLDVPAFEIGETLYWGYDRLEQLEQQL